MTTPYQRTGMLGLKKINAFQMLRKKTVISQETDDIHIQS